MRKYLTFFILCTFLTGCGRASSTNPVSTPTLTPVPSNPLGTIAAPAAVLPALPAIISKSLNITALPLLKTGVPNFDHVILILFENHGYNEVIGNSEAPTFNELANQNVLLTHYYAVSHPSLPNYISLVGGSTFGIKNDCGSCIINQTSLPDLIEGSGRTWKTYQESMPSPCTVASTSGYDENHNPFVYFDPIQKDPTRCQRSVVPLSQLDTDLSANQLPNFAFIMPNLCDSAHSCSLSTADTWLKQKVGKLQASPALGQNYAIFVLFDESSSDHSSCCGLPSRAGGRVFAMIISTLAKPSFRDDTRLSHYSVLKTILLAWNLSGLGFTENPATQPITAPWKESILK